jgi:uncharacterized protein (TIGR04141 family)
VTTSCTIFLLKDGAETILKPHLEEKSGQQPIRLSLPGADSALLFTFLTPNRPPVWLASLQSIAPPGSLPGLANKSAGAVLMLHVPPRHFAVAFGTGWAHVPMKVLVPDFGRLVALNAVDPNKLRRLRRDQVFTNYLQAEEQAPEDANISTFGFEETRDLVAVVGGRTLQQVTHLGPQISGGTSLRVIIALSDLCRALMEAWGLYNSTAYKSRIPQLDTLSRVVDDRLIATADQLLDQDMIAGRRVVLATPKFGDESPYVHHYRFGRNTSTAPTQSLLEYQFWRTYLHARNETPSLQAAMDTPVHFLDENLGEIWSATVRDCISHEVSVSGQAFVTSGGDWFVASSTFLGLAANAVLSLRQCSRQVSTTWNASLDEKEYNKQACRDAGLLLMDREIVHYGGGQSKFEFCDMLDVSNRIAFFSKVPGKSAAMSHLVEQIRRTVGLFFGADPEFRNRLLAKYPQVASVVSASRPRPEEWELCALLLGTPPGDLPLFAKCGLTQLARELAADNHRFTVMVK